MYPLSMQLPAPQAGFAVANDEAEHQALTESGYGPAYVAVAIAAADDASGADDAAAGGAKKKAGK